MSKKSRIHCGGLIYLLSFVLVLGLVLTSVAKAIDPDLVGWWKFDDSSGNIAKDSSGNGNDGTIYNGAQTTEGQIGKAFLFDEVDDYVLVPDFAYGPEFTVAFWFKSSGNAGDVFQYMFSHAPFDTSSSLNIYIGEIDQTGGYASMIRTILRDADDSVATGSLDLDAGLADGNWHHYGLTVSAAEGATVYINGIFQLSEPSRGGDAYDPTSDLYFGGRVDLSAQRFFGGALDDVRIYSRALTQEQIQQVMKGPPPGMASDPKPADRATDVPRDVVFSWRPGVFEAPTNGHKVYFGESFNDVNDATGATAQDANSYTPAQRLDFNTTYYWRVDEVNAPPTSHIEFKGDVWSFTTELFAYPIDINNITATASSTNQEGMEPENTINGSGLNVSDLHSMEPTDMWLSGDEPNGAWIEYELDKVHKLHEMWVWNRNGTMESVLGFGLKDVTIEYSTNGTDYTTLGTTHEFARAPGLDDYAHNTTVDFSSAVAKYVRLTANSNWGGILTQYGLSEVRFFSIPVFAKEPSPDSGATDVDVDVTLGFRTGREAVTHDVYFSTNEQAVIDGNAPVSTVTETSYGPLSLDLGTTYYWKINEVNVAETPKTWQGDIWNFTTREFFVVDDFEDYNDYPPNEIWSTWVDGYGVPANGATAGYPDPVFIAGEHFVETTIVHGGDQSMPFFYSNTGGATYSEGARTFAVPQDWTAAGVQTLAVHFHGIVGNTGQLYVKVNGSKVVYDGDAADIQRAGWQAWNIELASFGVDLQSVTTLAIGIDDNGASGILYFDDFRLYPYSREFITPAEPNNAGLVGHWKFDGDTLDYSGLGNDGTAGGDPTFVVGKVGSGAIDLDGIGDYVSIDGVADDITTNIFTLTAWIKTTQTVEGSLFGTNTGGEHDLQFGVKDGNAWVDDGPETQFPPAVNDDQWYFVTYVRDGATSYIYVDGALRGTDPATDDPASDTRWSIGQEWDPPNPSDEFEGMVDDVRFYNYALSLGEVAWLAGRTEPFDKPF